MRSSPTQTTSFLFQHLDLSAESWSSQEVPGTSSTSIALSRIARTLSTSMTRAKAQSRSSICMRHQNSKPESRSSMSGTTRSTTRRTNGHGRQRMIERVGTKDHLGVLKVCRCQQKIKHIHMTTPSHGHDGKILVQPTSKRASSILQVMLNALFSSSS